MCVNTYSELGYSYYYFFLISYQVYYIALHDRISFFVSKCVSFEIHKRNIYIINDDLNTDILKRILFCNAILEESFLITPLYLVSLRNII